MFCFDYFTFRYADTLYKDTSKLNHSCFPNMVYINSPSFHISWITGRVIRKGEDLTICYDEDLLFESTLDRRLFLFSRYQFWCECRRCSDPTELSTYYDSLPCFNCLLHETQDPGYLLQMDPSHYSSDFQCDSCHHIFVGSKIELCIKKLESLIQSASTKGGYVGLSLQLKEMLTEKSLHKHHKLVFQASLNIMAAIRVEIQRNWRMFTLEDYSGYLQFADSVHEVFTIFVPFDGEYQGLCSIPF
jgi:hypothetical protein